MKEKFLPIGTVVLLEGGIKPVMIVSYGVIPSKTQDVNIQNPKENHQMYEYGGCTFPEGVIDSNILLVFNHNQIHQILHMGFENDDQREFNNLLVSNYDNLQNQYESGQLNISDNEV